jgi:hypothetical protein
MAASIPSGFVSFRKGSLKAFTFHIWPTESMKDFLASSVVCLAIRIVAVETANRPEGIRNLASPFGSIVVHFLMSPLHRPDTVVR